MLVRARVLGSTVPAPEVTVTRVAAAAAAAAVANSSSSPLKTTSRTSSDNRNDGCLLFEDKSHDDVYQDEYQDEEEEYRSVERRPLGPGPGPPPVPKLTPNTFTESTPKRCTTYA